LDRPLPPPLFAASFAAPASPLTWLAAAGGSADATDVFTESGMYDATSFHVFTSGVSQSPSADTATSSTRCEDDIL
jgi:hypothetical protein